MNLPAFLRLVWIMGCASLRSVRFGIVNRDIQPSIWKSALEYWRLFRIARREPPAQKRAETFSYTILGLRITAFSPGLFLFLTDEVFFDRTYSFQPNTAAPAIIDCGSNVGFSILFFKKKIPRAKIIGFEPDPDTYRLLRRNLEQNAFSDVTVHNAAVSDRSGEIAFYLDRSTPWGNLMMSTDVDRGGHAREIKVPAVQLSTFIEGAIDLIKMDVEGAEFRILHEIVSSNRLENVRAMILEYHHHIRPDEDKLSSFLRLFEENSFGYWIFAPRGRGAFQDIQIRAYNKRGADAAGTVAI